MQLHVFPRAEIDVEARILKHNAKSLARLIGSKRWVQTIDFHFSAGGLEQRREHLDSGGFARPIWSEKREDFASGHFERNILHGGVFTEPLGEILNPDHVGLRSTILNGAVQDCQSQWQRYSETQTRNCVTVSNPILRYSSRPALVD